MNGRMKTPSITTCEMKRLNCILFLLACLAGMGCQPAAQTVSVSTDGLKDIAFDGYGHDRYSFTVTADGPWSIVKQDLSWVLAEPAEGGAGKTVVHLSAVRNLTTTERKGILRVTGGATTPSATISQAVGYGLVTYGAGDDGTLSFDCRDEYAVSFKVRSNVRWVLRATGLDWLHISPREGGPGETTVTVTPEENMGAERSGTLTLVPEQGEGKEISFTQREWRRPPYLEVTAPAETIVFPGTDAESISIRVASNEPWTIETDAGWLVIDTVSGSGEEEETVVHVRAEDNTDVDRTATLSVISRNDDLGRHDIQVRQKNAPSSPSLLAKWTLEDGFLRSKRSQWLNSGDINSAEIPSDDLDQAVFQYIKNPGDNKSRSYIFSSTGGHYVARPAYEGDFLKISVPVDHLSAGTRILLKTAVHSSTARSPRNYAIEFLDGDSWKACEGTSSVTFESNKSPIPIDAYATLSDYVDEGMMVFRIRVSSNIDISGATPNSSATMQITQRDLKDEEYTDCITIWQMPK